MARKFNIRSSAGKLAERVRKSITDIQDRVEPYIPKRPERLRAPSMGSHLVSALGWGFFTAMLAHFIWQCNIHMHQFGSSLTMEQMHAYKKICKHRAMITMWSLIIAFLPAFLLVRGWGTSTGHFLFFWVGLTCILYCIWPKRDYMLNHIQTPQQASQWYAIYMCMKHVSMVGFMIGFLLSLLVGYISYPEKERSVCNVTF